MLIHSRTLQPIGPGTALVQRVEGLGMYLPTTCSDQAPGAAGVYNTEMAGLGCPGGCKGGLGFFDSGTDISGWGLPEWGTVAIVGYMLLSTVFTTGRAVRKTRARVRKVTRGSMLR